MKMQVTDPSDAQYVRENFYTLEALCERAGLPRASYVLADGTAYFPADYFDQRFSRADFEAAGLDAAEYEAFLAGTYGICLHRVTPQNIARKAALIDRIAALIESPAQENEAWLTGLQSAVEELDAMERPFTEFDRAYFGRPVSRDTYITGVRKQYPGAFTRGDAVRAKPRPPGEA